jgi:hypothetical protein
VWVRPSWVFAARCFSSTLRGSCGTSIWRWLGSRSVARVSWRARWRLCTDPRRRHDASVARTSSTGAWSAECASRCS